MYRRITTLCLTFISSFGEVGKAADSATIFTRGSARSDVVLLAALGTVEVRVDTAVEPTALGSALLIFPVMATVDYSGRLLLPDRRVRRVRTGRGRRRHPGGRRRRRRRMMMVLLRNRTGHRRWKRYAHSRRSRLQRAAAAATTILDRAAGRVNRCDDPARYGRRRLFGTV